MIKKFLFGEVFVMFCKRGGEWLCMVLAIADDHWLGNFLQPWKFFDMSEQSLVFVCFVCLIVQSATK